MQPSSSDMQIQSSYLQRLPQGLRLEVQFMLHPWETVIDIKDMDFWAREPGIQSPILLLNCHVI